MRRFFFKKEDLTDGFITLKGDECNHLKNVLRLKEGEDIICFCGDGFDYSCRITKLKDEAVCEVQNKKLSQKTPKAQVTLFQGSLKKDKMEFLIQKLAEIGLWEIIPFESEFSTAKWEDKKIDRFKKIASEASKQCGRADILQVQNVHSFKQLIMALNAFDLVIFANEKEKTTSLKDIDFEKYKGKVAVIVGSEGGFSDGEIFLLKKDGIISVSLGKRVLKAETAGLVLCGIVMFLLGELN